MTSATTYGRRARTTVPLPSALSRRSGDWDASAPAALTGTGSLVLVQFLTLVVALVLIGRLGWWQVVESARLTQRLEAQKLLDQPLPATRGAIRDTNGELLAGNLGAAFICAFPSQVRRPEDAAAKLAPVLGVSTQSILDALANTSASYVQLRPRRAKSTSRLPIRSPLYGSGASWWNRPPSAPTPNAPLPAKLSVSWTSTATVGTASRGSGTNN